MNALDGSIMIRPPIAYNIGSGIFDAQQDIFQIIQAFAKIFIRKILILVAEMFEGQTQSTVQRIAFPQILLQMFPQNWVIQQKKIHIEDRNVRLSQDIHAFQCDFVNSLASGLNRLFQNFLLTSRVRALLEVQNI